MNAGAWWREQVRRVVEAEARLNDVRRFPEGALTPSRGPVGPPPPTTLEPLDAAGGDRRDNRGATNRKRGG